jgi:hypothetical protein
VWIFIWNGSAWVQQGSKLLGTGATGTLAQQGYSVALSADGNTLAIGANQDGNIGGQAVPGATWIFVRSGTSWSQQGSKIVGTGATGPSSQQGSSVSLSLDGNTLAIGAAGDDFNNGNVGATWIWIRTGTTWSQQTKIVGSGGQSNQGVSVSLSADGNTVAIGGELDTNVNGNNGATWIYVRAPGGTTWSFQAKLIGTGGAVVNCLQGHSVSLSGNGLNIAIAAPGDSCVYIFTSTTGVWTQQIRLTGTGVSASIGSSVSISFVGDMVSVGVSGDNTNQGATLVYHRYSGTTWRQQGPKYVGTGGSGSPQQGSSVSLSADGNIMAVGGYSDGTFGAAWIFDTGLTAGPTSSPSRTPSKAPTSSRPSIAPTTSRPSATPITSRPSWTPTKTPTTSRPSRTPSRTPSLTPTTSRPSTTPTTSRPSRTPSKSPTTSRPSLSPSTSRPSLSPSTSRPSLSPSTSVPTQSPTITLIHAQIQMTLGAGIGGNVKYGTFATLHSDSFTLNTASFSGLTNQAFVSPADAYYCISAMCYGATAGQRHEWFNYGATNPTSTTAYDNTANAAIPQIGQYLDSGTTNNRIQHSWCGRLPATYLFTVGSYNTVECDSTKSHLVVTRVADSTTGFIQVAPGGTDVVYGSMLRKSWNTATLQPTSDGLAAFTYTPTTATSFTVDPGIYSISCWFTYAALGNIYLIINSLGTSDPALVYSSTSAGAARVVARETIGYGSPVSWTGYIESAASTISCGVDGSITSFFSARSGLTITKLSSGTSPHFSTQAAGRVLVGGSVYAMYWSTSTIHSGSNGFTNAMINTGNDGKVRVAQDGVHSVSCSAWKDAGATYILMLVMNSYTSSDLTLVSGGTGGRILAADQGEGRIGGKNIRTTVYLRTTDYIYCGYSTSDTTATNFDLTKSGITVVNVGNIQSKAPTPAPTSIPSQTPTTSRPSKTPTTSRPSLAPSTSRPSMSPTITQTYGVVIGNVAGKSAPSGGFATVDPSYWTSPQTNGQVTYSPTGGSFTMSVTGLVYIFAQLHYDANTGSNRELLINYAGTYQAAACVQPVQVAAYGTAMGIGLIASISNGAVIVASTAQSTGGALGLVNVGSRFGVMLLNSGAPYLYVSKAFAQSIPTGGDVISTYWGTPVSNQVGWSNGVITIQASGTYVVAWSAGFAQDTTGSTRVFGIRKGTVGPYYFNVQSVFTSAARTQFSCMGMIQLTAGETLTMTSYHNGNGAILMDTTWPGAFGVSMIDSNRPFGIVYNNGSAQVISNGGESTLSTLWSPPTLVGGMTWTGSAFVAPVAGAYLYSVSVNVPGTVGARILSVYQSSSVSQIGLSNVRVDPAGSTQMCVHGIAILAAGESIRSTMYVTTDTPTLSMVTNGFGTFSVAIQPSPIQTFTPSQTPTTSRPSRTPSKTPTTSRPSRTPSKTPSRTPSRNPSKTPTTSRPSLAPTTSRPSTAPTTSRPSRTPSRTPSKTPTTSRPSTSPSTSVPTGSPTITLSHAQIQYSLGTVLGGTTRYSTFATLHADSFTFTATTFNGISNQCFLSPADAYYCIAATCYGATATQRHQWFNYGSTSPISVSGYDNGANVAVPVVGEYLDQGGTNTRTHHSWCGRLPVAYFFTIGHYSTPECDSTKSHIVVTKVAASSTGFIQMAPGGTDGTFGSMKRASWNTATLHPTSDGLGAFTYAPTTATSFAVDPGIYSISCWMFLNVISNSFLIINSLGNTDPTLTYASTSAGAARVVARETTSYGLTISWTGYIESAASTISCGYDGTVTSFQPQRSGMAITKLSSGISPFFSTQAAGRTLIGGTVYAMYWNTATLQSGSNTFTNAQINTGNDGKVRVAVDGAYSVSCSAWKDSGATFILMLVMNSYTSSDLTLVTGGTSGRILAFEQGEARIGGKNIRTTVYLRTTDYIYCGYDTSDTTAGNFDVTKSGITVINVGNIQSKAPTTAPSGTPTTSRPSRTPSKRPTKLPTATNALSTEIGFTDNVDHIVSIGELLVYTTAAPTTNVALSKTVTVSSSYDAITYPPTNAVDGNTASFTHTNPGDTAAYVRVALGAVSTIGRIVLYNRQACCPERIIGVQVSIKNTADLSIVWATAIVPSTSPTTLLFTWDINPNPQGRLYYSFIIGVSNSKPLGTAPQLNYPSTFFPVFDSSLNKLTFPASAQDRTFYAEWWLYGTAVATVFTNPTVSGLTMLDQLVAPLNTGANANIQSIMYFAKFTVNSAAATMIMATGTFPTSLLYTDFRIFETIDFVTRKGRWNLNAVSAANPLGTSQTLVGYPDSTGSVFTSSSVITLPASAFGARYHVQYYVSGTATTIVLPSVTATGATQQTSIQAPDGTSVLSSSISVMRVFDITSSASVITWGTTATLPTSITSAILIIEEIAIDPVMNAATTGAPTTNAPTPPTTFAPSLTPTTSRPTASPVIIPTYGYAVGTVASQTIPNGGAATSLASFWASPVTSGSCSISSGVFTISVTSLYYIFLQVEIGTSQTGSRQFFLRLNGGEAATLTVSANLATSTVVSANVGAILSITSGQVLSAYAYQSSGSTQSLIPNEPGRFGLMRLGTTRAYLTVAKSATGQSIINGQDNILIAYWSTATVSGLTFSAVTGVATITTSGPYMIAWAAGLVTSTSGNSRTMQVRKNSASYYLTVQSKYTPDDRTQFSCVGILPLVATDTIGVNIKHDHTSPIAMDLSYPGVFGISLLDSTLPYGIVFNTATAQVITNSAMNILSTLWGTSSGNMAISSGVFTAPSAGPYFYSVSVSFPGTTGTRAVYVFQSSASTVPIGFGVLTVDPTGTTQLCVHGITVLAAGETIWSSVYQVQSPTNTLAMNNNGQGSFSVAKQPTP